jgi:two-component system alkaline phosphatase synthesis response regulator PhoP
MAKKILLIEDEQYLFEMYKMKLEQGEYKVLIAMDGEEGMNIARTEKPDLVLLDLVLPKMNGYEFLREIRKDPELKKTKVYILSNLGQDEEIDQGFTEGADGYMIKTNLTPGQLLENVNKIFLGENVGIKRRTQLDKKY